jgi:hypothetical protein
MADTFQLQWDLKPKITALQAEAKAARATMLEQYKTKEIELATRRDQVAREQYGAEQQIKSSAQQLKVEQRDGKAALDKAAKLDRDAAAADKRGDRKGAEELRERADAARIDAETHDARFRQIEVDTSDLKLQVAEFDHQRDAILRERDDHVAALNAADKEVDKLEEQARMLEEARLEYAKAELMSVDDAEAGTHIDAAEKLVKTAEEMAVDRDVIRVLVPDLAETTPGYDDPAPPLPEGTVSDNESDLNVKDLVGELGGTGGAGSDTTIDENAMRGESTGDDATEPEVDAISGGEVSAAELDVGSTADVDALASQDAMAMTDPFEGSDPFATGGAFEDDSSFTEVDSFASTTDDAFEA